MNRIIELNGQTLGVTFAELLDRAQNWRVEKRLRKLQGEAGELIAAIDRYLENPGDFLREKLAEELIGVTVTLAGPLRTFEAAVLAAAPRQALRLKAALEKDGL